MQKQRKPIPVMYRGIVDTPKAKASQAKQANDRNKTIASYYFDEAPTIPNLAKGVYYWTKGNLFGGSEDPEDYIHIKGEPFIIGGPSKTISSTGAKVLKEVVGKRPQKVVEVIRNGVRDFQRGVARGTRVGRKEGAEEAVKAINKKVSRAYKLGVQRGTQTAERTAKKTAQQKAQESVQEAQRKYKEGWTNGRKQGADIQRRWLERSSKQAASSTSAGQQAASSTSAGQQAAETPGLGFWGNTRRVLWETKNNNFGKYYKWRNTVRVPIYMAGTPFIMGSASQGLPEYFKYMGTAFEKGRQAAGYKPDSTSNTSAVQQPPLVIQDSTNNNSQDTIVPVLRNNNDQLTTSSQDTIVPIDRNNNDPVTTSSREQLDSINKAWGR